MSALLGCDPGLSGGLVLLDETGPLAWSVMPTVAVGKRREVDSGRLAMLVRDFLTHDPAAQRRGDGPNVRAVVELVGAMPRDSKVGAFAFGRSAGVVHGILAALGVPTTLVLPQRWQRSMLDGLPKGSEPAVAARLWPDWHPPRGPRSGKPHDGVIDAVLIAEFGRRAGL